jgi:hypothetical protein
MWPRWYLNRVADVRARRCSQGIFFKINFRKGNSDYVRWAPTPPTKGGGGGDKVVNNDCVSKYTAIYFGLVRSGLSNESLCLSAY